MIKKLGILGLLFLAGAGATLLFIWSQATKLPDWYTQASPSAETAPNSALTQAEIDDFEERQSIAAQLEQKVATSLAGEKTSPSNPETVSLNAREFNQFVVTSLPKTPKTEKLLASVKAINTDIRNGQIKSGIIISTAALPLEQLPPTQHSAVKELLRTFSFLQDEEIYIGIKGQPRIEQGRLVLDEQTQVMLGGLTFSLADLASQLSLPEEKLVQTLSLQLGQFNIDGIEFSDQSAILKGSVQ
jgi:hypothetical protein